MGFRLDIITTDDEGYPSTVPAFEVYPTEAQARRAAPRVMADVWDELDKIQCVVLDISYRIVEARPAQVLAFPRRLS